MKIEDVMKYGLQVKGQTELIKYLNGETLSRTEAMDAKCYECCNGYIDGKANCEIRSCPVYGFMQYNPNKKLPTRNFSPAVRLAQKERMKKLHEHD